MTHHFLGQQMKKFRFLTPVLALLFGVMVYKALDFNVVYQREHKKSFLLQPDSFIYQSEAVDNTRCNVALLDTITFMCCTLSGKATAINVKVQGEFVLLRLKQNIPDSFLTGDLCKNNMLFVRNLETVNNVDDYVQYENKIKPKNDDDISSLMGHSHSEKNK